MPVFTDIQALLPLKLSGFGRRGEPLEKLLVVMYVLHVSSSGKPGGQKKATHAPLSLLADMSLLGRLRLSGGSSRKMVSFGIALSGARKD